MCGSLFMCARCGVMIPFFSRKSNIVVSSRRNAHFHQDVHLCCHGMMVFLSISVINTTESAKVPSDKKKLRASSLQHFGHRHISASSLHTAGSTGFDGAGDSSEAVLQIPIFVLELVVGASLDNHVVAFMVFCPCALLFGEMLHWSACCSSQERSLGSLSGEGGARDEPGASDLTPQPWRRDRCKTINQATYDLALSSTSPSAITRLLEQGRPLLMFADR